jgi:hypothetical protein
VSGELGTKVEVCKVVDPVADRIISLVVALFEGLIHPNLSIRRFHTFGLKVNAKKMIAP